MITQKIDAITEIPREYRSTIPPAPKAVKIELTAHCNYRCGFCASRIRSKARGEIDRGFFERIVLDMVKAGVREIGLFYIGESFLCGWLHEAIAFCKKNGVEYVFLTTNGALATPARVSDCMAAGLDSLKFSFNYSDAAQLKRISGAPAHTFAKVISNIRSARSIRDSRRYATRIYASSIRYDDGQGRRMESAVGLIRDQVDEHYWLPLYSFGAQAAEQERAMGYKPRAGNPGRADCMRDPLPCWAAFTEGHVTWDGKLSACCFDAGDQWEMGDLNRQAFMEAWHSGKFQELRSAHLAMDVGGTACEKCVAYK